MLRNYVHNNGQLGILGLGDDVHIESNAVFRNNVARFATRWEAGGIKVVNARGVVLRGNFAHYNLGPGLWTDGGSIDVVIEQNISQNNTEMGIVHSIGYDAVIRDNILRWNGFGSPEWVNGAGILVSSSANVEVYNNLLEGNADGIAGMQQARGAGAYGPYILRNLQVHDNVLVTNYGWTGVVQDANDASVFTPGDSRFYRNTYRLMEPVFTWENAVLDQWQWQSYGQDVDGRFESVW